MHVESSKLEDFILWGFLKVYVLSATSLKECQSGLLKQVSIFEFQSISKSIATVQEALWNLDYFFNPRFFEDCSVATYLFVSKTDCSWWALRYIWVLWDLLKSLHSYVFWHKDLKSSKEGISGWREFNVTSDGISYNRFIDLVQDDRQQQGEGVFSLYKFISTCNRLTVSGLFIVWV